MIDQPEEIMQSLTAEQIKEVAERAGVTESSIVDVINFMNKNDFIVLGLVDMTPDLVLGFCLCEQQYAGDI
jgi:hypothetical protein